jgi:hypothetical protein
MAMELVEVVPGTNLQEPQAAVHIHQTVDDGGADNQRDVNKGSRCHWMRRLPGETPAEFCVEIGNSTRTTSSAVSDVLTFIKDNAVKLSRHGLSHIQDKGEWGECTSTW